MPELPEVETIRAHLVPRVIGRTVEALALPHPEVVRGPSPSFVASELPGRRIEGLWRRGKYLVFDLSGGLSLVFHFRMSGHLLLQRQGDPPDAYLRASFALDDGSELRYCDARKLGGFWLVKDVSTVLSALGPEPLTDDFTAATLYDRLKRRRAPIKALLLDQRFLAGVGNIYADEALFEAGISPLRPATSLTEAESAQLHCALQAVLRQALGHRGTSIRDYRDPQGMPGTHQHYLRAYGRQGQPCPRCGTPIERLALRGRSAHRCPHCQQ